MRSARRCRASRSVPGFKLYRSAVKKGIRSPNSTLPMLRIIDRITGVLCSRSLLAGDLFTVAFASFPEECPRVGRHAVGQAQQRIAFGLVQALAQHGEGAAVCLVHALAQAVGNGDTAALRKLLGTALSGEDGRRLAQQLRQLMEK